MLVNDSAPIAHHIRIALINVLLLSLLCVAYCLLRSVCVCALVKISQRIEELHYLCLGQDVRENTEVVTESGEAVEIHEIFMVLCVEGIVREHALVDSAEQLDHELILQDVHQLLNVSLARLTLVNFLNHAFRVTQCVLDQHIQTSLQQFHRLSLLNILGFSRA